MVEEVASDSALVLRRWGIKGKMVMGLLVLVGTRDFKSKLPQNHPKCADTIYAQGSNSARQLPSTPFMSQHHHITKISSQYMLFIVRYYDPERWIKHLRCLFASNSFTWLISHKYLFLCNESIRR